LRVLAKSQLSVTHPFLLAQYLKIIYFLGGKILFFIALNKDLDNVSISVNDKFLNI
jgi:hypothetical protein